ncbi:MAG: methyltransferase domain-containing protein [Gammaproteobacteria bacterium]
MLREDELTAIASRTLRHYDDRAERFWEATRDHDVSQNRAALLRHIRAAPPLRLLDLGCGPGRDLIAFRALGHLPTGLEGAPRMCALARRLSGCEVLCQDFLHLDLPADFYDGIFANAALFHIPAQELPRVLLELRASLKPGGVLFSSNPHGDNQEGWQGERYGCYHDLAQWRRFMRGAGFGEIEHFYRPTGLPRAQQPFLASVWKTRETPA